MNQPGNGQRIVYEVHMSQQLATHLKRLHGQAIERANAHEFLKVLRQIVEHLRNDPLDFGEALYSLPSLRLLVRQAVLLPIAVNYAVHQERPLVFLRAINVL